MDNTSSISAERSIDILRSHDGNEKVLVLDTRPFISFNTSHIENATNVHCPPILKRRSGGFVALENIVPCEKKRQALQRGEITTVIAYDQNTTDLSQADRDSNLYSVLKSLKQQVDVSEVYYVKGGFEALEMACPDMCLTQKDTCRYTDGRTFQHTQIESAPVEILPYLYLGNYKHACQGELLKTLGITSLLNVSTTCQNHFEADFRYMNIPVNDTASAELQSWFVPANNFIESVKGTQGKVLVHCHAGVSRSATICLAYLMSANGLSLDNAYEHVRSRRDVINPNLNFMQQLKNFETQLLKSRKIDDDPVVCSVTDLSPPVVPPLSSAFPFTLGTQSVSSDAPLPAFTCSPQSFMSDSSARSFSFSSQELSHFYTSLTSPS